MLKFCCTVFVLFSVNSFGQKPEKLADKGLLYKLNNEIEFIIADTCTVEKKPIFLFLQGSQPIPILIDFKESIGLQLGCGLANFDLDNIRKQYHIVVISMPNTPITANLEQLNAEYNFVGEAGQILPEFHRNDFIDNYVARANSVLNFLEKQAWVNSEKVVIAGHSQGAKVATLLTKENPVISHVGLFGFNAFGRIDQQIRTIRKEVQKGTLNWEEAEKEIENTYSFYRQAVDSVNISTQPELLAWKSFSKPILKELLEIEIPIYMTYGTEDIGAELCDLLPLYFIQKGKTNLSLKRYHGLEHNFFEMKPSGRPDFEKPHWKEVMNEFLVWVE